MSSMATVLMPLLVKTHALAEREGEKFSPAVSCILTAGLPRRENTPISAAAYWLYAQIKREFTKNTVHEKLMDRMAHYEQECHTWIEIWMVQQELDKFQSMYRQLKSAC